MGKMAGASLKGDTGEVLAEFVQFVGDVEKVLVALLAKCETVIEQKKKPTEGEREMQKGIDQLQIADESSESSPPFDVGAFWQDLKLAADQLIRHSTMFAIAMTPWPGATTADSLCSRLKHSLLVIVSTLHASLDPKAADAASGSIILRQLGRLCSKKLLQWLIDVLAATKSMVAGAKCNENKQLLITTGTVWEQCEARFGQLPRSNVEALRQHCGDAVRLVDDAWKELKQSTALIDVKYHHALTPSLGLIRCSRAALQNVSTGIEAGPPALLGNTVALSQLDTLGDLVDQFSEAVDDLAVEFYRQDDDLCDSDEDETAEPTVDLSEIEEEAEQLFKLTDSLLSAFTRSLWYSAEKHSRTVDSINTANAHNLQLIQQKSTR